MPAKTVTTLPALSAQQVRALKVLVRHHPDGLTRQQLQGKIDGHIDPHEVGAVKPFRPARPGSLQHLGLVRTEWHRLDDRDRAVYHATPLGVELAPRYALVNRASAGRIPADVIDRAVLEIKPTRPYGFEKYTSEDLAAVRGLLGPAHADIDDDTLRRQMAYRRRCGAYTSPDKITPNDPTKWPAWYVDYRRQISLPPEHGYLCALNHAHDRRRVELYCVSFEDVDWQRAIIALCPPCFKKARRALPVPPAQRPAS